MMELKDIKKGMLVSYKWEEKGREQKYTGRVINIRKGYGETVVVIDGHKSKPLVYTDKTIRELSEVIL